MAQNSSHKLDIIAQYWQLNAQPKDPRSGDYGYSEADMSRFGAAQGSQVYKAIEDAADRNVSIRYNTQLNSMHATFQLFLSIFFFYLVDWCLCDDRYIYDRIAFNNSVHVFFKASYLLQPISQAKEMHHYIWTNYQV